MNGAEHSPHTVCKEEFVSVRQIVRCTWAIVGIVLTLVIVGITWAVTTSNQITELTTGRNYEIRDIQYLQNDVTDIKTRVMELNRKLDMIIPGGRHVAQSNRK